jgi:hypothetical protein
MSVIGTKNFPAGLLTIASKQLDNAFSTQQIVQYCSLAFEIYTFPYARQHHLLEDCVSVHCRDFERMFGRGQFVVINDKLDWIEPVPLPCGAFFLRYSDNNCGLTKAYRLTSTGRLAIREAVTDSNYPLTDRKLPANIKALRSRDAKGSNAKGVFDMKRDIRVKERPVIEALESVCLLVSDQSARGSDLIDYFRRVYKDLSPEEKHRQLIADRDRIIDILQVLKSPDLGKKGFVPQYYVQSSSGRWYCHGPIVSFQNMPKQLRPIFFQDCYDYDIESCHYSIFAQLAVGCGVETPTIDNLLANKVAFRESIARDANITLPMAKRCLISLIYGAPLNPSEYTSFGATLGITNATNFCKSPKVIALHKELSTGRKRIINKYIRQSKKKGWINNDVGRARVTAKSSQTTLMAHILQGVEAQILSCIGSHWGNQLLLLMHDGFVTRDQLDTELIRSTVLAETGWDVHFSEERISII